MDDSAPGQDGGDSPDPLSGEEPARAAVVDVSPAGAVVLDVKFETSPETVKAAKRALQASMKKPGAAPRPSPNLSPEFGVQFRVDVHVLRKHSKYFDNLLGNSQFTEAKLVQEFLASHKNETLRDAETDSLPRVSITDDDEATRSVGREKVFEDMLRILHGLPIRTGLSNVNMLYVSTLAVLADRFDCQAIVSNYLSHGIKFKWPLTSNKPLRADNGAGSVAVAVPSNTEEVLRQKVLAAYLLRQPLRLQHSTRELIRRGSALWSPYVEDFSRTEAWLNLPDDLEHELQFRRECILNTLASIQRHFLALYTSRQRQCKLGYDSSAACDSFQVGEMVRFFTARRLLALVDFGPSSLQGLPDASTLDLDELLATLRQCPSYQVDRHHTNCGLRTRLEPIVEYVQTMLSSNAVSVSHSEWTKQRETCSWAREAEEKEASRVRKDRGNEEGPRKFEFTRSLASDQRLRYEGALYADKMARKLFTADAWDWTPEY